jgi:hypothetical protein
MLGDLARRPLKSMSRDNGKVDPHYVAIFSLYGLETLAGGVLEANAVNNGDLPVLIVNVLGFLEHSSRYADGGAMKPSRQPSARTARSKRCSSRRKR